MEKIILKIDDRRYDMSKLPLSRLSPEDINYQTAPYVDEKWKRVDINVKDKKVLDIGCNIGGMGVRCLKAGCKKYNGVDSNWRYLEQAVSVGIDFKDLFIGEINEMDFTVYSPDITLLFATFHYVKPELRDIFIETMSKITKEMLVLEGPVENGEVGFAPKQEEIEMLLNKHFARVEFCGESIPHSVNVCEQRSKRFIWKAYKK